jgi:hypothetical protein
VLAEPVVVAGGLAPPDWELEGGPATDTVLVAEPHPLRSAPAHAPSTITVSEGRRSLIVPMVFGALRAPPRSRPESRQKSGTIGVKVPSAQIGESDVADTDTGAG